MKNKNLILSLVVIFIVLIGASCASNDVKEETEDSNNHVDEAVATAGEAGEKTVVYGTGGEPSSLDSSAVTDGETSKVTSQIMEGLVGFERDSFDVVPELAYDWDISDDGLRYTFYLEEGVLFHDGTEFNAEAVKINFDRWSDPEHEFAFTEEGYMNPRYIPLFGGNKGDENHLIEEINVINDYEIEFVLKRPDGAFLRNLAVNSFTIMSPTALEEYGPSINENPVGTGPFKFVSWNKDESIILEKFGDYRIEGLPKIDRVIFEVIPENSARLIALKSGDIDIMDGLNIDDAPDVMSDDNLELVVRAENNFGYLGFNTEKEPLDNKLVRQAINYAIDREAIVDAMYGDYGAVAKNPLPPSEIGYNEETEFIHDPDKARELLIEAGYEDGLRIELWAIPIPRPYLPNPDVVSEIIQHDLAEIGIDVKIVNEEWAAYLEKIEKGEQQMFMLGGTGINGDPSYGLNKQLRSTSSSNYSFYKNPEIDELLDEAMLTMDESERIELYEKIQEIAAEDVPMVPLVHSRPLMAISNKIENFKPHPSTTDKLVEVDIKE